MLPDTANEADVREEIAAPMLAALGYRRGTENDILREFTLRYGRLFLGRKKETDPPLRGRADYILSVLGAGRWTLETKPPSEEITQDAIEQAISYARHPEVAGAYAAVLNGKRFVLYSTFQPSTADPILALDVVSVDMLVEAVRGTLTPAAVRRDCTPPVVDTGRPIVDGLRSRAAIRGGQLTYTGCDWACPVELPTEFAAPLDDATRRMTNFRVDVLGGEVWRDDTSRIRAKLKVASQHEALRMFAQDKGLSDAEYVSLDRDISTDPATPTMFDVVGTISIASGEQLFNIARWETEETQVPMQVNYRGQASGVASGLKFAGAFLGEMELTVPGVAGFWLNIYTSGEFEIELDPR
jgi:hypothetical protein